MTDRSNSALRRFSEQISHPTTAAQPYYVELPLKMLDDQGYLIDSVISFTFDTLHVQHLDLRIVAEEPALA
jgi:hypothetical protein